MAGEPFDWESFLDIVTPEEAARAGSMVRRESGRDGGADGGDEDYRFWCAVFARLRAGGAAPAALADGRHDDHRFWSAVLAELAADARGVGELRQPRPPRDGRG